jgi:hypothetical protein
MTRRGRLGLLAAPLVGLALFAGAARVLDPRLLPVRPALPAADEAGIREAIESFNRIYQDFYASGGNPALIDEFPATRAVKHFVFRDLGFVRDAGLVQVQDLASAEVREVRAMRSGEAEALVYEEWNLILQGAGDRAPRSSIKGMGQGFRYWLRREGRRWIVTAWDLEELPAPPERGFEW